MFCYSIAKPVSYRIIIQFIAMNSYTQIFKEKYEGKLEAGFPSDCKRIDNGEPIDYVIGFTPFLNTKIDLSARPFLPRVETEFWVEKALRQIDIKEKIKCLDIFSGSGCIGIALLKSLPNATVTFGEQNPNYIKQISININVNGVENKRALILETDLFSNIKDTYDYIFANPPYISRKRKGVVQPSVLRWEPKSALFAPDNGLFYIKKLLTHAKKFLTPGGTLLIEFDSTQKRLLEKFVSHLDYRHIEFERDQYNKWRVLKVVA